MALRTYSFADVDCTILPASGAYPQIGIKGEGVGSISYDYINDNTAHDIGADGQVMPSKIIANNGHITITALQTSQLYDWMVGLYNYLMFTAPTSQWTATTIKLSTLAGALDEVVFTGVSFVKPTGRSFEAKGGNVIFPMMAADIRPVGIAVPTIALNVAAQIKNNI